jgi:hypothetical protein
MENKENGFEWKGIKMEDLRQIMDDPADNAVKSIFEKQDMGYLTGLLKNMAENDDVVSVELPEAMQKFADNIHKFKFSEKDIQCFVQTHKIWEKHGMKFIFILFFRALPYTYRAEKPANVLRMTKLLITHAERRIFETAQFVFDVMDENWWEPKKKGILTATKVRIMHAAMRHVILDNNKSDEQWNSVWGKPISQEDLIATNQVFSLEFFKGLEILGEGLKPKEQEAWFHTWKTIGKIMGVQDNLISKNVKEAWSLQHVIYDHLFRDESHSGVMLAKALVETMSTFHLPTKLTLILMRRMLADKQFPDSFEKMLGPSYKDEYPELFEVHTTSEDKEEHEERLRGHYHSELKDYYQKLNEEKKTIIKKGIENKENNPVVHKGLFEKIIDFLMNLVGISKKEQHLIDVHIELLHNVLHHKDTGNPVEELEEEMILDSMTAMGGIMIAILNGHFRKGKDTGFRIPATLQDNWQLKG